MFTGRELSLKVVAPGLMALMLAACGSPATPTASVSSPPSTSPSAATSPGTSPAAKPTPGAVDVRLVIEDIAGAQVRLAKLDATRTATVPGRFVAIVNDHVIVLAGTSDSVAVAVKVNVVNSATVLLQGLVTTGAEFTSLTVIAIVSKSLAGGLPLLNTRTVTG